MEALAEKSMRLSESLLELLRAAGPGGLSTRDLLAIVMGGEERKARLATEDLLGRIGAGELALAEMHELEALGVSESRAARIVAAIELGRRAVGPKTTRLRLEGPEDAAGMLRPLLVSRDREHFLSVALDGRNGVITCRTVSIGTANAALVYPRDVLRVPLMVRAVRVLLAHNHPSNLADPSSEDVVLTRRLIEAGNQLGIDILDHIIIGDNGYQSLRRTHPDLWNMQGGRIAWTT